MTKVTASKERVKYSEIKYPLTFLKLCLSGVLFVKCLSEQQTVKTLIRLLHQEQSDWVYTVYLDLREVASLQNLRALAVP